MKKINFDVISKGLEELFYSWERAKKALRDTEDALSSHLKDNSKHLNKLEIPKTEEKRLYLTVSSTTYQSTNSGDKYAKCSAELIKLEFEDLGIKTEIEESKIPDSSIIEYNVYVYTTSFGLFLAKYATPKNFSLKNKLKFIYKNSCNPRVFYPTLRHGIEEELGIDYFGNDKTSCK